MATLEHKVQDFLAKHDTFGRIFSGGVAGIVAKSAIAPLERIKMSFQVSNQHYTSLGALNRGKEIYKSSGISPLNSKGCSYITIAP